MVEEEILFSLNLDNVVIIYEEFEIEKIVFLYDPQSN